MAAKGKKGQPVLSVLAFSRKIIASDGYMYETTWEKRLEGGSEDSPIRIREKTVRGTQSHSKVSDDKKVESNIQTVDEASLSLEKDTLKLKFSLKFLPQVFTPTACNLIDRYSKILQMGEEYKRKYGYEELAKRYALNIANARYLWRNRLGAEEIEVIVKLNQGDDQQEQLKVWKFNAYDFSLKSFETKNEAVLEIADIISSVFRDERKFALFDIEVNAKIGNGQEVYPSEEFILNKEKETNNNKKGNKGKVLYQVNDNAAVHSQKINNAIRTIDTWYTEYTNNHSNPIAVEPFGTVTNFNIAYRATKTDFYTIFNPCSVEGRLPESEEESHFIASILIRGGVLGEASDDKKQKEK